MSKQRATGEGQPGQSVPAKMRPKHDEVVALIDEFSRKHLNEEYRLLCRELVGLLARKRPSPLVNGTSAAWACGIIRAIGFVNFLHDRSQTPHVQTRDIDAAFGVSTATGQARSKAIRDMLKTYPFDPKWTLPSRLHTNPMVWLIQVNGFTFDARCLPREIQEEAFHHGLIPYIPADHPTADDGNDGDNEGGKSLT